MKKKTIKKKHHTAGTVPKSNIKIVDKGQIDTSNTHIVIVHFSGLLHALKKVSRWQEEASLKYQYIKTNCTKIHIF